MPKHILKNLNSSIKTLLYFSVLLFCLGCGTLKWSTPAASIKYVYDNTKGDSLGAIGDFEEVKLIDDETVRLICRFYNRFENKSDGIEIQIGIKTKNSLGISLNNSTVTVSSKNFTDIQYEGQKRQFDNEYIYFFIPVESNSMDDIKSKLSGDRISIKIYEKSFEFLAPTFEKS